MNTKTIKHNGIQYVLERDSARGAIWQLYRIGERGREHVAAGYYQNDLIDRIKLGRFEAKS